LSLSILFRYMITLTASLAGVSRIYSDKRATLLMLRKRPVNRVPIFNLDWVCSDVAAILQSGWFSVSASFQHIT